MISWNDITGIGDTVVMLPAAAVIGAWLLAARAARMAVRWCAMFGAALVCVLMTKIAFAGWGIGIRAFDFAGISGHAMRALAVLPVLCYLALRHAPARWRVAGVALGMLGGGLISASRLALQLHSLSETVAGAALGLLVSLGFIWVCRAAPMRTIPRSLMGKRLVCTVCT